MHPSVSIIIPAYNAEKWIRATILSALSQTWTNKEIIIVDDGSTDHTNQIARSFASSIVKVVQKQNGGASAARNFGLSLAQGDVIQWLDADDILAPDKIELQIRNGSLNRAAEMLHSSSWGFFYHRLKSAQFISNPLWNDLTPVEWLTYHLRDEYFMYPASWLVSRKLTELAGPWDERLSYNDDGEYFCRVICASDKVMFHAAAKSYYRKGSLSSLSRSLAYGGKAFASHHLAINLCVDHLLKLRDTEFTRKACIKALNRIIAHDQDANSAIFAENKKRIYSLGGRTDIPVQSKYYQLAISLLGAKNAMVLKNKVFHGQIIIARYREKIQSIIYGDGI